MKLLFAEDEVSMAEAVTDILTYHNYSVDTVYNGADALEYARTEHYDGIILDIMMPKKNGLEVLKTLRSEGCTAPILLLTAKAEVEDKIAGLDMGADDYLAKPFVMGGASFPCESYAKAQRSVYARCDYLRQCFTEYEQL